MTRWVGLSICLGALAFPSSAALADTEETRPLQTVVETVKGGAKVIGQETQAAARDIFVLVQEDATCLGTSLKEAPAEIGAAARTAGPDLVDTVEGLLQSPEDGVESLADWLLEPLDVLAGDDLF